MKKTPFNKLTKEQKRIAIVKDVIKRIDTKQFKPILGRMVDIMEDVAPECDIQKLILKDTKCQVCAKGGLFLSFVRFTDKFTTIDMRMFPLNNHSEHTRGVWLSSTDTELNGTSMKALAKVFSKKQLSLIESAYEGDAFGWNLPLSDTDYKKCNAFYNKYRSNKNRLLAICNNMLKNKGIFIP